MMVYDALVFLSGLVAGGLLVGLFHHLRVRTVWSLLTEYYYSEHLYPLIKRGVDVTHYRLAWESFRVRLLGK